MTKVDPDFLEYRIIKEDTWYLLVTFNDGRNEVCVSHDVEKNATWGCIIEYLIPKLVTSIENILERKRRQHVEAHRKEAKLTT